MPSASRRGRWDDDPLPSEDEVTWALEVSDQPLPTGFSENHIEALRILAAALRARLDPPTEP